MSRKNAKGWRGSSNSGRAARQRAWRLPGAMATATAAGDTEVTRHTPFVRDQPKVKPNEPCYCGSGKKYKKCHGAGM